MKYLIAYYSRGGHNLQIAKELKTLLKADIEEIIDLKPKNIFISIWQSLTKQTTEIKEIKNNPKKYDITILITPIWAGSLPPATRTYLKNYLQNFKKLSLLSVSGQGSKNINYIDKLEQEYSVKISPRLLISDYELKTGNYKNKLLQFAQIN